MRCLLQIRTTPHVRSKNIIAIDIAEELINSAQLYYELLDAKGRGIERIPITDKVRTPSGITLKTSLRSWSGNLLLLSQEKEWEIGSEAIEVGSYDEKRGIIKLLCDDELATLFMQDSSLELLSDMKFLVRNVERFYSEYGDDLELPNAIPEAIPAPSPRLSTEQQKALEMIFSTPLSYTWGAPGTGKTKGVLFESLLFTITRGVRAFLLAPTNSALEQALRALMPKFDELGFERTLVFRMGEPSASFLAQYPEVCDPFILNKTQNATPTLFSQGKEERERKFEESLVLAMTVDGFIKRFDSLPKGGAKHIFLDEAAFVPLIKALALCALHAPISMLGDHKQLPPVCEASEIDLEGEPLLNAWQYSALHLRDYFRDGAGIFSSHTPTFPQELTIPQSNLSYSHRYGENLTKILDKYIYKIGLRGLSEPTELYYVDSGLFMGEKKGAQANLSEADALAKVAQELARAQEDFGIITPFVKQRRAILERLPMLRDKDCVLTIHRSQGREFHTVLFSPVMLHYHLTNSLNLSALHALNVAISRAKKRVIIVCDYRFWMEQKGQFLSAILTQSSPLELGIIENIDTLSKKR